MQLNLAIDPPDLLAHKCLVLGVFSDEKPPRGPCGLIDWRLNGMISNEIKNKRILGDFREKVLIPHPGRIGAEIIFLFGLGPIADVTYDRIYTAAYDVAAAVDGMRLGEFSFDLPGAGRSDLATAGIVEAMITGVFDFLSNDIQKLAAMNACVVTSAGFLKGVKQGLNQFHQNVRHLGSVDFSAAEACLAQLGC
ncbi:MAG: M17 family peptidase N-terminal domain-containing protein [Smithellaceae bacterium]